MNTNNSNIDSSSPAAEGVDVSEANASPEQLGCSAIVRRCDDSQEIVKRESVGTIYREVTLFEEITPDGERTITRYSEVCRSESGCLLSVEDARAVAQSYALDRVDQPAWVRADLGYPGQEWTQGLFLGWLGHKSLARLRLLGGKDRLAPWAEQKA